MKKLSANWYIEGLIDFEYKQYVLLAYLAEVQKHFEAQELYPSLSELIFHFKNLQEYKNLKNAIEEQFPSRIAGFDPQKLRLAYEPTVSTENNTLQEIDQIVEYSIPAIRTRIENGKNIYETVESYLTIEPIGLEPLYKNEGYVLTRYLRQSDTDVYYYKIDSFTHNEEKVNGITTKYVTTFQWGIISTYESMKMQLIKQNSALPNPATYLVEAAQTLPKEETLLPITKRKLLRIALA